MSRRIASLLAWALPVSLAAVAACSGSENVPPVGATNTVSSSVPVPSTTASAAGTGTASSEVEAPPEKVVPSFPRQGFDWPQSRETVEGWVAKKDVAAIRRHGFYLFAGLHTDGPDGRSLWLSWPTTTQVFPPPPTAAAAAAPELSKRARSLRAASTEKLTALPGTPSYDVLPQPVLDRYGKFLPPGATSLPDGPTFENNGDVMIAGVIYDGTAAKTIVKEGLNSAPKLREMQSKGQRDAEGFSNESFVLKNMYWPIMGDAASALPVWDDEKPPAKPVYAGYETWKRAVAVDPTGKSKPGSDVKVSLLHGVFTDAKKPYPTRTWTAKVVPLDRFYSRTLSASELDAMAWQDRAILDASMYWANGRLFQPGDVIVEIAMHVMTREQPTWTFQSLWWSDAPDKGPFAQDRPDIPPEKVKGPWRWYLLTSTYGIAASSGPGKVTKMPVAYNPFIELAAGHPIDTNCISCHFRAAFPEPSQQGTAGYDDGPGRLDLISPDAPYFKDLIRTQYQWAIPDRAR